MCYWADREMAKGSSRIPAYAPYLVPKLSSPPWMPDRTDRATSFEGWNKNSKKAKRKVLPQELAIQAWIMYRVRILFAAESCRAFDSFGGLCAQFNLLGVVLNLTVTEGVSLGMAYFRILIIRSEEIARQRAVGADGFIRLLAPDQLDLKEQARRECALAVRGDPPKGSPRSGKGSFARTRPSFLSGGSSVSDHASSSKASPYRPVFATNNKGSLKKGKKGWRA